MAPAPDTADECNYLPCLRGSGGTLETIAEYLGVRTSRVERERLATARTELASLIVVEEAGRQW